MQIHIAQTILNRAWGGGNQFLRNLKHHLSQKGLYEEDSSQASVIIFNSYPFREEWRFNEVFNLKKKNNVTVIHRVDGPTSTVRGDRKWKYIDEIIYKFNDYIVDGTIFQSNWSMERNRALGMKSNKFETVIHNGTDPSVFSQKKRQKIGKKIKIVASSWSANWKKGFQIYNYLDKNLDFSKYEMTFIGNTNLKFRNIEHLKPLSSEALATKLSEFAIYITASIDDPCSNSLIEAISVGLPVVALNSGGHPEIIEKTSAGLLFNDENDVISVINKLTNEYPQHLEKIKPLTIEDIGNKYVNFIQKVEMWKEISNIDIFKFQFYQNIKRRLHRT